MLLLCNKVQQQNNLHAVSQLASANKQSSEHGMNCKLNAAQHQDSEPGCLCTVGVMLANKLPIQELNRFNRT